jgi:hypothetical protein
VQAAIGLEAPERLIPPRFRAVGRRAVVIELRHIERSLSREPAAGQLNLVRAALASRNDVILIVKSLEIPPTQTDMLHQLAEHVQIAATVEDSNRRNRIMRLLWRFQLTLDLRPLTRTEVRARVTRWLERNPLDFESRGARGLPRRRGPGLQRHPGRGRGDAQRRPGPLTRASVVSDRHDAAVTLLDMTPMVVIAVAAFMALRHIGRGAGLQELMVLAGVGWS